MQAVKPTTPLSFAEGALSVRSIARLWDCSKDAARRVLRQWEARGLIQHTNHNNRELYPKARVIELMDMGLHVD